MKPVRKAMAFSRPDMPFGLCSMYSLKRHCVSRRERAELKGAAPRYVFVPRFLRVLLDDEDVCKVLHCCILFLLQGGPFDAWAKIALRDRFWVCKKASQ